MGRVTSRHKVLRVAGHTGVDRIDTLVVEEPLELRVGGAAFTVTMRTPGDDFDLAAGFLAAEGVVTGSADIATMRYCAGTDDDGVNTYNVLDIALAPHVPQPDASLRRNFATTSACGVCGKASLDAVRTVAAWPVTDEAMRMDARTLTELPDRLRAAQRVFDRTGGLHAAGLFAPDGELLAVREDVGRHNAVDKLIGWAVRADRLPLRGGTLMVSGRASFELAQKAVMAGIPVLAAVSAPSSLAVDLAADAGLTLIGFLRGDSMNVYTGRDRVALGSRS